MPDQGPLRLGVVNHTSLPHPAVPHHGKWPDMTCVAQLQAVEASILVAP